MKKLFIIANWKSNKTVKETEKWLHDFDDGVKGGKTRVGGKKVIVASSFVSLEHARYCMRNLKLSVESAAQDISPFDKGAYTGEVNGAQIKEFANYVIVGHSERRKNFGEDDDMVAKKIEMAMKHSLIPILCISNLDQVQSSRFKIQSYDNRIILAYEPLFAIGSGQADTPQNAESVAAKIKEIVNDTPVLYGGSVTSLNVNSFTKMPSIDGVLVGGASLNPLEFLEIVKNA
ncbi:MAG: triose-phosphate isomerase family protein [Patescibacteria group bacterium]